MWVVLPCLSFSLTGNTCERTAHSLGGVLSHQYKRETGVNGNSEFQLWAFVRCQANAARGGRELCLPIVIVIQDNGTASKLCAKMSCHIYQSHFSIARLIMTSDRSRHVFHWKIGGEKKVTNVKVVELQGKDITLGIHHWGKWVIVPNLVPGSDTNCIATNNNKNEVRVMLIPHSWKPEVHVLSNTFTILLHFVRTNCGLYFPVHNALNYIWSDWSK